MNLFEQLIWDLGELTKMPLHIDENNACRLLIEEKLPIHLEMEPFGDQLIVIALLSEIPPGRFREDLLKSALRTNASYNPAGVLAYAEKKNILILYKHLVITNFTGELLAEFLISFINYAKLWQVAIESGVAPSSSELDTPNSSPPFGFK